MTNDEWREVFLPKLRAAEQELRAAVASPGLGHDLEHLRGAVEEYREALRQ